MKKRALSAEMRDAIVWLERQPGVTSVVQGRYTSVKHKNTPGFARLVEHGKKSVTVRLFDKAGTKDCFVYADENELRVRWMGAIASGTVLSLNGDGPSLKPLAETVKTAAPGTQVHRPSGAAIVDARAAQLILVTPEMAMDWLSHNTRNRDLRQSVVNRYAADMKAGRWLRSPDAIAFDTSGAVINGQHRLWAVVEAGVTVEMTVMYDMAPETVNVLDDHLKRNLRDVARIRRPGEAIGSRHTSIARLLLETVVSGTAVDRSALERISRQAQLDTLDRHREAIEFTVRDVFKSSTMRSITVAAVQVPIARAYYTQDRDRLRQFGKVMLTGMVDNAQDDNAAIQLRNFLLRLAMQGARPSGETIYRKTERAMAAFLTREKIATLYEASEELFPLPEERRQRKG